MKTPVTEIAERADALYAARLERQNVRLSVELLDATLAQAFDYELAWRQGRALFFLGQEAEDSAQARAFHRRAIKICEQAAREQAARVEGHFWRGVNLALLAALEKPFKALGHALAARRALRRALAVNPAYHAAGPLRVLARLEAQLPRWLGGGHNRARANFEKAIALAPANTITRLYFAELLLAAGDEQSARRQLEALLNAPPDPAWAFETARDRRLAQAMLKKAKVKR
jgi:tetratricopeptide (TPR) repeat protein